MRRGIGYAIPWAAAWTAARTAARAAAWTAAWLAATSAGLAGSWLGCAAVLNGADPAVPVVLSSVHSRHEVSLPARQPDTTMAAPGRAGGASTPGGADGASTPGGADGASTAGGADGAAASTPTPAVPARPTASPTPQASTMLTPVPRAGPPDPTTGRPGPGGEPDPAPVEPTTSPAPSASAPAAGTVRQQTFQTRGGTATVRFGPGRAELLDARPAGGFRYVLEQTRPDALRLLFLADRQESELLAGWGGEPVVDIVEYWW
jgi:hypothetical protein